MKFSIVISVALSSLLFGASSVFAQTTKPTAASEHVPFAVIDVGRIFRESPRFSQLRESLKQEVELFEKKEQEERQAILKQRDRQQTYSAGSPEYKEAEADIARRISDQQVRAQLKRKDLAERETKALYETYQDVSHEVGKIAAHYGISLVLNNDGQKMSSTDQRSVQMGINRPIVYQRIPDLTNLVLKQLNPELGTSPQPGQTSAAPAAYRPAATTATPGFRPMR